MKQFVFLSLLALLIGAASCHKNDSTLKFQLDQAFTLDFGATSEWADDPDVNIRFDKTVADSRCPIDAECVWAGRVEVQVTFTQPNGTQTGTLALGDNTGTNYSDTAVFGNFTVKLLNVKPQPKASQPIDQADYQLELKVTKTK